MVVIRFIRDYIQNYEKLRFDYQVSLSIRATQTVSAPRTISVRYDTTLRIHTKRGINGGNSKLGEIQRKKWKNFIILEQKILGATFFNLFYASYSWGPGLQNKAFWGPAEFAMSQIFSIESSSISTDFFKSAGKNLPPLASNF